MISKIHLIFLILAVITSIIGCQRGNDSNSGSQLVNPQQIRELQGQYYNARGDRLKIGPQGEVQWSQVFAFENGSCRETFTGRLLQFEPIREPSYPLANMALHFETTESPRWDGWIQGRQVTFQSRPEMLQACRAAFPGRGQRSRQVPMNEPPALTRPVPPVTRPLGRTGPRSSTTPESRGGRAFQIPESQRSFVQEVISLPVTRLSQDVLVLAFAPNESDFARINDVFVKNSSYTRPVNDLIQRGLTSSQFVLAGASEITLRWVGEPLHLVLDAERTCGIKLTAPLEPSQITYPSDASVIPNIQFALRLTNEVSVIEQRVSNSTICASIHLFLNQIDRNGAVRFETKGRESLVLMTENDGGLLFHRQN